MRRLPAWLIGLVGLVLSFLIVSLFLFNSSQRTPNSTAATAGSTAETPHSAVQTPRSTATIDDALDAYEAGDYPTALRNFQRLANEGNLKAQKILGFIYHVGRGVPQNYAEALKWYRKAADQGYVDAQNSLGRMYESGHGVRQDYAEAASVVLRYAVV